MDDKTRHSFLEMAELCNKQHLETCTCQKHAVDTAYKDLVDADAERLEEHKDDSNVVEARLRACKRLAIEEVSKLCVEDGIRCSKEIDEIILILKMFEDKYDVSDVRVFMIVKSVVAHKLSAIRMQRYSSSNGILQEVWDRNGNVSYSVNPVEKVKMDFDDSVIKAIQILDKIINGDKTLVEHSGKIDLSQVLQNIEDMSTDQLDVKE